MTKSDKNELKAVSAGIYILINLITLVLALSAGSTSDRCSDPLSKIEYIFPGFPIGCWLSSPLPGIGPKRCEREYAVCRNKLNRYLSSCVDDYILCKRFE